MPVKSQEQRQAEIGQGEWRQQADLQRLPQVWEGEGASPRQARQQMGRVPELELQSRKEQKANRQAMYHLQASGTEVSNRMNNDVSEKRISSEDSLFF